MIGVGIFAKTFPGKDPSAVLSQLKAAGYQYTQFNLACAGLNSMPDEIPVEISSRIRAASQDSSVPIVALSGTTNMAHPDRAERTRGRQRLANIIAAARPCGTSIVTLCTGSRDAQDQWRPHPDNVTEMAWSDMSEELAAALELAEKHDVVLAVEPEAGNVVRDAPTGARLLRQFNSRHLRIILDPANLVDGVEPARSNSVLSEAIDLLGASLCMVHAKDRNLAGVAVAPGKGRVEFPAFLNRIRQTGFSGPLVAHGFEANEARMVRDYLGNGLMA